MKNHWNYHQDGSQHNEIIIIVCSAISPPNWAIDPTYTPWNSISGQIRPSTPFALGSSPNGLPELPRLPHSCKETTKRCKLCKRWISCRLTSSLNLLGDWSVARPVRIWPTSSSSLHHKRSISNFISNLKAGISSRGERPTRIDIAQWVQNVTTQEVYLILLRNCRLRGRWARSN